MEEDSHLGALLQYVYLNPVRAGMCDVEGLKDYRWSSYWYLQHPELRSKFLDPSGALRAAWSVSACETAVEITHERKSAVWKIWIASELKRKTSAPSTWIAHQLNIVNLRLKCTSHLRIKVYHFVDVKHQQNGTTTINTHPA